MEEEKKQSEELEKKQSEDERKIHFWIILCTIFFILSAVLFFVGYKIMTVSQQDTASPVGKITEEIKKEVDKDLVSRFIDGVYVKKGIENIYPVAVMIDNHVDARPPLGLSRANLVYEAEAEGGITRYLAIFASGEEINGIGPVRSARPYFVDWASEFSALYTHVGGSPEALAKMTKEDIFHINEFYQGEYFWRGDDKIMPHNVYTSTNNLYKYLEKKDKKEGAYFSWVYKDEAPLENRGEDSSIRINFLLDSYKVEWKYSKAENNYTRYLAGIPHEDMSGEVVKTKNILIEYIEAEVIDNAMRLKMDVTGSGRALVCFDGKCNEGDWKKSNKTARTRFYINDQEVEFNRGTTWIEVVRPEREVIF